MLVKAAKMNHCRKDISDGKNQLDDSHRKTFLCNKRKILSFQETYVDSWKVFVTDIVKKAKTQLTDGTPRWPARYLWTWLKLQEPDRWLSYLFLPDLQLIALGDAISQAITRIAFFPATGQVCVWVSAGNSLEISDRRSELRGVYFCESEQLSSQEESFPWDNCGGDWLS